MKREDDQELWDLLGRAAEPKISPFFARNVLRETRKPADRGSLREWLSVRRLLPIGSMAVALIGAFFVWMQMPLGPPAEPEVDIFVNVAPQDYEVVADLDELLASDESNPLDDNVPL